MVDDNGAALADTYAVGTQVLSFQHPLEQISVMQRRGYIRSPGHHKTQVSPSIHFWNSIWLSNHSPVPWHRSSNISVCFNQKFKGDSQSTISRFSCPFIWSTWSYINATTRNSIHFCSISIPDSCFPSLLRSSTTPRVSALLSAK
jgi:hypothetical protein